MPASRSQLTLLIVLGLVAAMAIGAAITLWLSRGSAQPSTSTPTASGPAPRPSTDQHTESPRSVPMAASNQNVNAEQETGVFINERQLTPQQVGAMVQIYRYSPPRGHFWYDSRSGLYGLWGHEAAGFIHPGHDFGPLPPNASNGNTGVFINGRELNMTEALYCQQIFGAVYRGRAQFRAPIVERYEEEGSPYFSTARLWDDGIIDPLDTRRVLGLALDVCAAVPLPDPAFGLFRM